MASPSELPKAAGELLRLARHDRRAAARAFAALDLETQVALVCETPVTRRAALLELAPKPEELVPRLPEAELCFTAKAVGLADAGWLLALATPEQLQACVDLDAWRGDALDLEAFDGWLAALAEGGDEALVRGAKTLDAEAVVLFLQSRLEVWLKPNDPGWEPPDGSQTLDGVFWLRARREDDDLAVLLRLFHLLHRDDYWQYFRMLQGAIWEPETETRLWAARFREGRLQDLGFPPWEEALGLFANLPPERFHELPEGADPLDVSHWRLPVWPPRLPTLPDARHAVFRAAAGLEGEERAAFFYAFVAAANGVAVFERLPLGDAESIPRSIERAAALASAGLEHLMAAHGLDGTALLRRVPLARLVRLGANLEREGVHERPAP